MSTRWMAVLGLVTLLCACATPPGEQRAQPWNGGTWNSVLGYVGPYNLMNDGQRPADSARP